MRFIYRHNTDEIDEGITNSKQPHRNLQPSLTDNDLILHASTVIGR